MTQVGAVSDFRWICPEEKGKRADEVTVDDGDVNPDVMAADFESPGLFFAGLAVDGEVEELRIAGEHDLGGVVKVGERFPFGQSGFEVHDFPGLESSSFAESKVHDRQREFTLLGLNRVEPQSAAAYGDVAPLVADVVGEGSPGDLKLVVVEGLEEGAGCCRQASSPVRCAFYACHACPPGRLWRICQHATALAWMLKDDEGTAPVGRRGWWDGEMVC